MAAACPICGSELPDAARFCPSCGFALRDTAAAEERRLVTVLFADLEGVTALAEHVDPESVKALLDACFDQLVPVIGSFGGHVDKIIGDELMAVFGAPTAHEDDAERAVRASLELHAALAVVDPGLRLRVGVNTGEVLAGAVGPSSGYTVTGDVVNTAHRLASVADPGEVLVGERTHASSSTAITYRSRGAVRLKGKQEPVTAWTAVGLASTGSGRSPVVTAALPIVGRERELADLRRRVDRVVTDRRSETVALIGEAGVGKTRLAIELAIGVSTKPAAGQVLWSSCPSYTVDTDLTPLVDLVRDGLGLPVALDRAVQRELLPGRLADLGLDPAAGGLERRLLDLLGLGTVLTGPVDVEPRPTLVGPSDQQMAAVASVLGALAARRPLVVVVDDLQWAGRRLVRFLIQLADWFSDRRLFVVCVARDDLLERHGPLLDGSRRLTTLSLSPLTDDATAELVCTMLGDSGTRDARVGPDTLDQLVRSAGGSPLLAEQLVGFLVESGQLVETDGRWVWTRDDLDVSAAIPDGLRSLIGARLDALPAEERSLLSDAAVIGRRFWSTALVDLSGHGRRQVEQLLDRLSDRGLVNDVTDDGGGDHLFHHALTRDVAYASLPLAERAERHAVVAGWIERQRRDGRADTVSVGLLAHHYERAVSLARSVDLPVGDLVGPAFDSLVAAAREEARRDSLRRADRWYRRARDLGSDDDEVVAEVVAEHGQVLLEIGQHEDARQAFEEVRRRAGLTRPPLAALAEANLGAVARLQGDLDGARERFDAAAAAWHALDDLQGVADTLRLQGWAEFASGRPRAAMPRLEHAAAIEEQLDEPVRRSDTLRYLGWCEFLDGRIADAQRHLWDAAQIASQGDESGAAAWCIGLLGHTFLRQGRAGQAMEVATNLREVAARGGDPWGAWTCATLQAAALVALGRPAEGGDLARQALERFEELDSAWELGLARFVAGEAARAQGDLDGARVALTSAVHARRSNGTAIEDALAVAELARVDLDAGLLDDADRRARAALALVRAGIGDEESELRSLLVLAQVAMRRGDDAAAELFLEDAVAGRAERDRTETWGHAALDLAERRARRGDLDGARSLLDAATDPQVDAVLYLERLAEVTALVGEA
jgi:class 3 adenylate cyclase/tetratricopeptide (TPR) repeat protein